MVADVQHRRRQAPGGIRLRASQRIENASNELEKQKPRRNFQRENEEIVFSRSIQQTVLAENYTANGDCD